MPSLRVSRPGRPRDDARVCGLWYLPLQAAWAVALAQRAIHQAVSDLRNVDSWVAHTINRRLTEQWAWEMLDTSPIREVSADRED